MKRCRAGRYTRAKIPQTKEGAGLISLTLALLFGGILAMALLNYLSPSFGGDIAQYIENFLGNTNFSSPKFPRLALAILPFPCLLLVVSLAPQRKILGLFLFATRGFTWALAIGLITLGLGKEGLSFALVILGGGMVLGLGTMYSLTLAFSGEKAVKERPKKGRTGEKEGHASKSYGNYALYALVLHFFWEGMALPWVLGLFLTNG